MKTAIKRNCARARGFLKSEKANSHRSAAEGWMGDTRACKGGITAGKGVGQFGGCA